MTIKNAIATLKQARAARDGGDFFSAAVLGFSAQRIAAQSRARAASDVAFSGHALAVVVGSRAMKELDLTPAQRSHLGRVRAESNHLFRA